MIECARIVSRSHKMVHMSSTTAGSAPSAPLPVTKAVVLARGLGTRMRAASASPAGAPAVTDAAVEAGAKGMIDVGRPFLDYVVSALADAGITRICLVIGPEHTMFREHFDSLAASGELARVTVSYAVQAEPLGTADAVAAAEDFAAGDRVVVINSDNYYPVQALRQLVALPGAGLIGFDRQALLARSNIPPDRIAAFAVLEQERDDQGRLLMRDIVEKPTADQLASLGPQAPLSMNAWLFTPGIFAACRDVTPSARGEYEITDAVRLDRSRGTEYQVVPAAAGVLDLSRRDDIASVRAALEGVEVSL